MKNLLKLNENQIVIFGIGTNARILKKIYMQKGIDIIAYLVGDDQKISITEYEGVPVYRLSDCNEEIKKYPVISSVRECALLKVKNELEQCGFRKVYSVDSYKEWVNVLDFFYRSYFIDKNIDIDGATLEISGSRFINGFQLDTQGKYSFLAELGDIILPKYFNDFTICNEGPYELEEEGFCVEKGDIVFDCGANMGLFSALAINGGGDVYSFEPTPHTRAYLLKYDQIYPNNIHIFPHALSDKEGETEFYVGSNLNGENSIGNLSGTCKERIIVPMKTIDNFVKEKEIVKVDFIKADIEGAERNMLLGAKEILKKFAPKLSICTYHLHDDPEVLENIILQANSDYKVIHKYKKIYAQVEK